MRHMRQLLAVVFLLTLLNPASAYAHAGWWDWIEELSGPGPFTRGISFDARLFCLVDIRDDASGQTVAERVVPYFSFGHDDPIGPPPDVYKAPASLACLTRRAVHDGTTSKTAIVQGYVQLRGGVATTEGNTPLFSDRPNELVGRARAHMWQLMAMRQLGPAISDGVGAGWFHIGWTPSASSDGTFHSQNFFVLTPLSIAVSPLRLLLPQNRKGSDLITVYFDELFLHGSRTARDFSPDSTSAFKMGGIDAVPSISINIDFLELKNLF